MNAKRKSNKEYFHSNEDKSRAVVAYITLGSFTKAANVTGIPENTIRNWAKQDWFAEEARRVDRADGEELKSVFTRIAKKASSELEERLEFGDEVLDKDGDLVRKKIPGKELAIIAAVAADKRKQQMDTPQTISIQNTQEKLLSLMESFIKFANAKEIKQEKPNETILELDYEPVQQETGTGGGEDSKQGRTDPGPDSEATKTGSV